MAASTHTRRRAATHARRGAQRAPAAPPARRVPPRARVESVLRGARSDAADVPARVGASVAGALDSARAAGSSGAARIQREAGSVTAPAIGAGWYAAGLGALLVLLYYVLAKPRIGNAFAAIAGSAGSAARAWMNPEVDPLAALHKTLHGGELSPQEEALRAMPGGGKRLQESLAGNPGAIAQALGRAPGSGFTPLAPSPASVGASAHAESFPGTPYPQPASQAQLHADRAALEAALRRRGALKLGPRGRLVKIK